MDSAIPSFTPRQCCHCVTTGCASDGSEMITSRSPSTQSWRKIKNVTVFFRNFFRLHRKDNEINALRLALRFIRSHPFPPSPHTDARAAGVYSPSPHIDARAAGIYSPSPHTDARAAGVFSPSPHTDARAAGVFSPSPFMERGGRQAGGEVKGGRQAGGEVRS